ncbi:hypothetical protein AMJ71_01655 [candidate division TA06 bacterium SM1_40]|uniref:Uncharacterized protein n=3 Tax=Bacteria division TA06 TaxID=1156500 RepID=A0A0S8JQC8_UNCT6|nr:MAG: hypothetical protein AMJ82_07820 [candidate division TA06 bacterium SM23_40]KPL10846.1 MAG: hypothetical protein AMJ71_01655 [candidate division TA06 bacterium SM1_40]
MHSLRTRSLLTAAATAFAAALLIILLAGCKGEDTPAEPEPGIDLPVTGDHVTDAQGNVGFDLGGLSLDITVQDAAQQPLEGILLRVSLSSNYVCVVANDSSSQYYPDIAIETLPTHASTQKPARSPAASQQTIYIVMTLTETTLLVYEYATDPDHIGDLRDEQHITWVCDSLNAEDLLAVIASYEGWVQQIGKILHVTETAGEKLGYTTRTIAFAEDIVNAGLPLFVALLGEALGIFGDDIGYYCYGTHSDGRVITPIYLMDIELHRDFELRLTLTWGQDPSDLDSHLWTPEIEGSTYHVYYASQGSQESAPYAELDVDDVTSYGPENITIYQFFPGTYYYSVFHFSGAGTIATSSANVTVLGPEGELHSLDVPPDSAEANWWWNVLTVNGETGDITIVDEISPNPPMPYLAGPQDWNRPK